MSQQNEVISLESYNKLLDELILVCKKSGWLGAQVERLETDIEVLKRHIECLEKQQEDDKKNES